MHLDSDGFEVVHEHEAAYLGREFVGSHPLHETILLVHLLTKNSKAMREFRGVPPHQTMHYPPTMMASGSKRLCLSKAAGCMMAKFTAKKKPLNLMRLFHCDTTKRLAECRHKGAVRDMVPGRVHTYGMHADT